MSSNNAPLIFSVKKGQIPPRLNYLEFEFSCQLLIFCPVNAIYWTSGPGCSKHR